MSKDGPAHAGSKRAFDDIFKVVGNFGRYQVFTALCVSLPVIIPSGFLAMTAVFFTATPADFWCASPANTSLYSDQTVPWAADRSKKKSCLLVRNASVWAAADNSTANFETSQCDDFAFDHSVYESTAVTEWNLVCDRRSMATWTFTAYGIGGIIGPLIWGYLADRLGRRKGFYICALFQSVATILTGFSPNYVCFFLCRLCVGMTNSASYTIPFVLTLEMIGPEKRALLSVLCSFTYSFGSLIFLAIAYFIRAWRTLAVVSSVTCAVLYLTPLWYFPESPRWLLSRGKYEELETFLLKVARVNRRQLSAEFVTALPVQLRSIDRENHAKKHSPVDLFRTPNMRKKTLTLVLLNICNKGVSLGLNYYTPLFSGNAHFSTFGPHFTSFLNTIVEFPVYFFAKFAFQLLGRRTSLFLGFLVGGVACLVTYCVPMSIANLVFGLALISKFCITFTYVGGKLFEDELFPTVVRSEGHSMVSVLSAVMSCGVPFIVDLGHEAKTLPLVIFGSLCTVASLATFLLPETVHQRLPQTMEDGEEFGKTMSLKDRFRLIPRTKKEVEVMENGEAEEMESLKPIEKIVKG